MKKTPGRGGAMSELLSKHNEHRGKDGNGLSEAERELYREELIRKKRNSIMAEIHRSEEDLGGSEESKAVPETQKKEPAKEAAPVHLHMRRAAKVKPEAKRPARKPQTAATAAPKAQMSPPPVHRAPPLPQPAQSINAPVSAPVRKRREKKKSGGALGKLIGSAAALLLFGAAIAMVVILIRPEDEIIPPPPEVTIGAVDTAVDETLESVSLSSNAGKALQLVSFSIYGADSISCLTEETTVGEIIDSVGIELSDSQVIRDDTAAATKDGMIICVDTVTYATETYTEYADYNIKYIDVQFIPRGQEQIHFKGSLGEKVTTYNIKYVNGQVAEKTEVSTVLTKSPLTQVVYRGVGGTITVGGKQYSYSHFIDCKTTVYCLEGITASGKPVGYDVIAVDPGVIPLGTKVFVDDPYTYVGFREAADTGGAIKGNFIDIWFKKGDPKFSGYGVRSARVYILD